ASLRLRSPQVWLDPSPYCGHWLRPHQQPRGQRPQAQTHEARAGYLDPGHLSVVAVLELGAGPQRRDLSHSAHPVDQTMRRRAHGGAPLVITACSWYCPQSYFFSGQSDCRMICCVRQSYHKEASEMWVGTPRLAKDSTRTTISAQRVCHSAEVSR